MPESDLSLQTHGSPGRRGAAGGRDVASTCLHSDQLVGESGGSFPTRFHTLRGGEEKESHDSELHERQRGEKVTQTAKNLLRCRFSFLLCSAEGSGRGWVTAWLLLPAE